MGPRPGRCPPEGVSRPPRPLGRLHLMHAEPLVPPIQTTEHLGWADPGDALELRGIQRGEVLAPGGELGHHFRMRELFSINEREEMGQLAEDGLDTISSRCSRHALRGYFET
jgi:hypothetical protein